MTNESAPKPLRRNVTRRAVLGGAAAAGWVAVAYAALGGRLPIDSAGGIVTPLDPVAAADRDALQSESVRISHLLRRTGVGVTREEFDRYQEMGLNSTTAELVNWTSVDDSAAEALASEIVIDPVQRANPSIWWLVRMANTKRPLQEKMTLFWHGLLTSQLSVVRDPTAMVAQNELFRAHAFDSFPSILKAVSMNPAMMAYLNIEGSQRRAPNENYARELMELFALGEGNYTETDVREAARAFTGWTIERTRLDNNAFTLGQPVFRPAQFDSGSKTFLGKTGNFKPEDIIDIITDTPQSARYITRRLFEHFVYAEPDDATLQPFVDTYTMSNKSIGATVEAMLRSDEFYSPRAYRAFVKSPLEYAVGAVKALGLQAGVGTTLTQIAGRGANVLTSMGQTPFEPPNVAGWPGGALWLNSATLFARLNLVNALTGGASLLRNVRPNQQAVVQPELPATLRTVEQALAHYLPALLDDNLPSDSRQAIVDYAGGPDAALTPETLRGVVYLMLAAPQFHLA